MARTTFDKINGPWIHLSHPKTHRNSNMRNIHSHYKRPPSVNACIEWTLCVSSVSESPLLESCIRWLHVPCPSITIDLYNDIIWDSTQIETSRVYDDTDGVVFVFHGRLLSRYRHMFDVFASSSILCTKSLLVVTYCRNHLIRSYMNRNEFFYGPHLGDMTWNMSLWWCHVCIPTRHSSCALMMYDV